ncbi:MAG: 50S ribosomal protein L25 [Parcubacteria group bacterium Athens0714_26]|nr:MAG: 50S ribosomal protein L25 [Parcubacteria group bacterium Athens1014_26]TSD01978.1 MAG: 50S ribosomal protein L25 [Parcubacteria group bacterium Athens0714_26]
MELQVQKRQITGTKVKGLRQQGIIPAEIYGRGFENFHLSVPTKDFKKVFQAAGENTVINLMVDGDKYPVLIHDVSYDGITGDVDSIDFYRVRMDEKIKVKVPVEFMGIAPAIKEKNGLLVKALHEVEVEALPNEIPHSFQVDLSKLSDIGQSIYVKDLIISGNVKVLVIPETVVATITAKVTEEEELAMQQEGAAPVEEVKVEAEEKKAAKEAEQAEVAPEAESAKPAK